MIRNFTGVSGSRTAYLLAKTLREENKLLAVVSGGQAAVSLAEDLVFCVPEAEVIVLPESEDVQVLYEARDRAALIERIKALQILSDSRDSINTPVAIIAPISSAIKLTADPARFTANITCIKTGDRIEPSLFRAVLASAGYKPGSVTESEGEFSSRGDILDVYPPAAGHPVRIEFFDDEVESIREFDSDSQRSLNVLDEISIGPAAEFVPTNEEKEKALAAIVKEYDKRIKKIRKELPNPDSADGRIDKLEEYKGRIKDIFEGNMNLQIYADFLEYFDVPKFRLWDFISDGGLALVDPESTQKELSESYSPEDFYEIYKTAKIDVYTPFPERIEGADRIDEIINIK
ncbi:MAG: hypothetical protein IJH57_04300, partial [Mogibacterium sp.]|nr:hypothetical protein [Mogibacterium sp.]